MIERDVIQPGTPVSVLLLRTADLTTRFSGIVSEIDFDLRTVRVCGHRVFDGIHRGGVWTTSKGIFEEETFTWREIAELRRIP